MKRLYKKPNERGFTLVELLIGIAIIAVMTSMIAPKAIEAQQKSQSNQLRDEFSSMISAFTTLDTSGGSSVHAIRLSVKDANGNTIMTEYTVPVAPSVAFATVTTSEVFRRTGANKPIELTYSINTIGVKSGTGYSGEVRHTGNLTQPPVGFTATEGTVQAPALSSQGAQGISPIFSVGETKLLEDFIKSPNGLDWEEYSSQLNTDYKEILATIFGGPVTNSNVSYFPYEPTPTDTIVVKSPIELTLVDVEAVKASSAGASLKTLVDGSRGAMYQVTGLMSREEFVATVTATGTKIGTGGAPVSADLADRLYDKIGNAMQPGTPVYIPHRARDIVKSTNSDLKYGFYRP